MLHPWFLTFGIEAPLAVMAWAFAVWFVAGLFGRRKD